MQMRKIVVVGVVLLSIAMITTPVAGSALATDQTSTDGAQATAEQSELALDELAIEKEIQSSQGVDPYYRVDPESGSASVIVFYDESTGPASESGHLGFFFCPNPDCASARPLVILDWDDEGHISPVYSEKNEVHTYVEWHSGAEFDYIYLSYDLPGIGSKTIKCDTSGCQ